MLLVLCDVRRNLERSFNVSQCLNVVETMPVVLFTKRMHLNRIISFNCTFADYCLRPRRLVVAYMLLVQQLANLIC